MQSCHGEGGDFLLFIYYSPAVTLQLPCHYFTTTQEAGTQAVQSLCAWRRLQHLLQSPPKRQDQTRQGHAGGEGLGRGVSRGSGSASLLSGGEGRRHVAEQGVRLPAVPAATGACGCVSGIPCQHGGAAWCCWAPCCWWPPWRSGAPAGPALMDSWPPLPTHAAANAYTGHWSSPPAGGSTARGSSMGMRKPSRRPSSAI